jgi:hypothetical protein
MRGYGLGEAGRFGVGRRGGLLIVILLGVPLLVHAQDWDGIDFVPHSDYQAVHADGTSAYGEGFPVRLRGVVLNSTEDWLDPTAAYDPSVHLWQLGGQAELYVQAVDSPEATWDDGDFGGTACWMGQNYGNHVLRQDPQFSYTDTQWYAELDRLHLWHSGSSIAPLVRAGSLVEIRARGGLNYAGKMNVNEQHTKDPANDFEVVILDEGFGLPNPTAISLSAVKDADDIPIFDPTRATGGEHYQSTWVQIQDVRLADIADWGSDRDLTLADATGRTLQVHLGRNDSFDATPAPAGYFNVAGILDQESFSGQGGYRLLALRASDFSPIGATGDANGDGATNGLDVDPFMAMLLEQHYDVAVDMNGDGRVDGLDVDPFVHRLTTDGTLSIPEPTTFMLIAIGLTGLLCWRRELCVLREA